MKRFIYTGLNIVIALVACNKELADRNDHTASISLINAIPSFSFEVKAKFGDNMGSFSTGRSYGYYYSNERFANGVVTFGLKPEVVSHLSVVSSPDTLRELYHGTLKAKANMNYMLFLSGSTHQIDTLMISGSIPPVKDNQVGIRFINLTDAGSLKLALRRQGDVLQIAAIDYQQITGYQYYQNQDLQFDITDVVSGDLLSSFFLNGNDGAFPKGKHITVLIRGSKDGEPGIQADRIDN